MGQLGHLGRRPTGWQSENWLNSVLYSVFGTFARLAAENLSSFFHCCGGPASPRQRVPGSLRFRVKGPGDLGGTRRLMTRGHWD